MKRSTWEGQTVVYRYGCPHWASLPESGMAQLRLAHELRNELVAAEYRYREAVAEVWAQHPQVAEASARVDAATAEIERLAALVKSARVVNRSTVPSAAAKEALAAARKARREAKAEQKAAKDAAKEAMSDALKAAAQTRYDSLTAARAEAVERGLFWGTANAVAQRHDTAAKRIAEAWKSGQAAQRRFKRWDGTGTLHTQVMWQAGKPVRSPEVLALPISPWRNVFRLETNPAAGVDSADCVSLARRRRGVAFVRLEKGGEPVSIPVVVHRPLPENGEVTDVEVTRFRIGTAYRLAVAVTVRQPNPEPPVDGVPVAVTVGWGSVPDGAGAIRVARISTPMLNVAGLKVPHDLRDVLVPGDGYVDAVVPAAWRKIMERDASIRGLRDDMLDALRPHVVRALTADPSWAETLGVKPADVERWRAARRFDWLAKQWPAGHVLDEQLHAELLGEVHASRRAKAAGLSTLALWRLRDRHLYDYESHERDQVIARRKDAWRKVVAWVCEFAAVVRLDVPPVAETKRVPDVSREDPEIARKGRAQAQIAAPGELAAVLRQAAKRRGIEVIDARVEG